MNLSTVRTVGSYIIGAVVGGVIGKMVAEYVIEKIEEREWKENVEEVIYGGSKQDLQYGPLAEDEVLDDDVDSIDGQTVTRPEVPAVKPRKPEKSEGEKPVKVINYNELSKSRRIKDSIEEVARKHLGEDMIPMPKDADPNTPKIISLDEYGASGDEAYTKMLVTYYDEDDTLIDENGDVSTDPDRILGPEALVRFGQNSGDPDMVYVRNELLRTDYEVVRVHGSFSEKVINERKNKRDRSRSINTSRSRKVNDIHADDEEDE